MKPMLAEDVESFEQLRYPLYGSYKVDGVRALMLDGELKPRSLKKFGNQLVGRMYEPFTDVLALMDGELTYGAAPATTEFRLCNVTTSVTATHDDYRAASLHWWVFDLVADDMTFAERVAELQHRFKRLSKKVKATVHLLEQRLIQSAAEAEAFEQEALALGYEGIVLKDPAGLYKYGRSTLRSQQFLRVKRFADAEIRITGFVERMVNNNVATTNELGHKTRSSHKANKAGAGTLGAIVGEVVTGPFKGATVEVGTGWDAATAAWIWANRPKLLNELGKFSYFPHGCKDKPRFPVWQGFRAAFDMST